MDIDYETEKKAVALETLSSGQVFIIDEKFSYLSKHVPHYMKLEETPLLQFTPQLPDIEAEGNFCFAVHLTSAYVEKFSKKTMVLPVDIHMIVRK